ncbi:TadE/TadG family type IV pilus assembly protein [Altererythrobacter sp. GH1-8]|uniref:TadE/TadG family type IV pilus assembly protein n=1 Tax=Altererythrobacter sp. GH1-8 TaxID=3349333 RepID=UPI00374D61FA
MQSSKRLNCDDRGAVVIETAFVVPILAVLALGGFEASMIISRNAELQVAAAEAAAITLARAPDEAAERDTLEDVIEASTGLTDAQVTLRQLYRCDAETTMRTTETDCASTAVISEYVEIRMRDTYNPVWSDFGFGNPINYDIRRRVQIS